MAVVQCSIYKVAELKILYPLTLFNAIIADLLTNNNKSF